MNFGQSVILSSSEAGAVGSNGIASISRVSVGVGGGGDGGGGHPFGGGGGGVVANGGPGYSGFRGESLVPADGLVFTPAPDDALWGRDDGGRDGFAIFRWDAPSHCSASHACLNGGRCVEGFRSSFRCECALGYSGPTCAEGEATSPSVCVRACAWRL